MRATTATNSPTFFVPRAVQGPTYMMPAIVLIGFVLVAPSIHGFIYSLYNIEYLRPTGYVGLRKYLSLVAAPDFAALILRSAVFAVGSVCLTVAVALPVSIWIDRLEGAAALVAQIIVVLPWVVSSLIGALLFRWVFVSDFGWVADFLSFFGVTSYQPASSPNIAMTLLIVFASWRTLGFAMLLLLAGLKAIPADLREAASIDGGSAWQVFTHVTLPLLKTPLMITVVVLMVSNLNNVEGPLIVTAGGPANATNVLPLDLYARAFGEFNFNTAIPLGIGMFVGNMLLALTYVKLVGRND